MPKKLSIITPCYNSFEFIDACYESLKNQTIGIENLELIFVNDASTDDTLLKLLSFEKEYPDSVLVINLEKNVKQGGARNIGLSYASGEYIGFLDSDDAADINAYKELLSITDRYQPDIIMFGHNEIFKGELYQTKNTSGAEGFFDVRSLKDKAELMLMHCDYGCWNKLYKKELLDRVQARYVEGVVYEEPSFTRPMIFEADSFYLYRKPLINYTLARPGNTMTTAVLSNEHAYDHPTVHIKTYEFMRSLPKYEANRELCDFVFIFSYIFETLLFMHVNRIVISYEYFNRMKEIVRLYIPDYRENPFLKNCRQGIAQIMDAEFNSQEDFLAYVNTEMEKYRS